MVQVEGNPGAGLHGSLPTFETRAESSGAWSFDLRPILRDVAGTYAYRLWVADGILTSPQILGSFTLSPITVQGFEGNPSMPLEEASTTGVVMALHGPANGAVCLDSWTGQRAVIPLDEQGNAHRRLRLLTGGFYVLNFRACSEGYLGANTEAFVEAVDPNELFVPWGPDPLFEVLEL